MIYSVLKAEILLSIYFKQFLEQPLLSHIVWWSNCYFADTNDGQKYEYKTVVVFKTEF